MRVYQGTGGSAVGTLDNTNFFQEYAAPAGMQLNTGVYPSFTVTTQLTCTGWHICITDTSKNDPGVKAAILIDDPDGIYWNTPAKFSNVTFDQTSKEYSDGELHPYWHTKDQYCFDINFIDGLKAAYAPTAIVDNLGNAIILRLDRSAPAVRLSTIPATTNKPDSIVFPVKKIGETICTTFVIKNTAVKGGTPLDFVSARLTNNDTSYKISYITPSLPKAVAAGDSVAIEVCYTPVDSNRHQDSLIIMSDCFSLSISLDAHGSTGLISSSDIDFGKVYVGDTICKAVQIKNVGSSSFTLEPNSILSDTIHFSIDPSSQLKLPIFIKAGSTVVMNICYHPLSEGKDTGNIIWNTDLEPAFRHSVKDRTNLTGTAIQKLEIKQRSFISTFTIHPNPAFSNIIEVTFDNGASNFDQKISILDLLGRELYSEIMSSDISSIKIPIGNLNEGTYFLKVGNKVERFVKAK